MAGLDPQQQTPEERARPSGWSIVGRIALGVALLLAVMAVTILNNDSFTDPHASAGAPTSAPTSADPTTSTSALTTTTVPTPLEQARLEGGYLVVEAMSDPLEVYDQVPPGPEPRHTLPQYGYLDVLATFWAIDETVGADGEAWYKIYLPVRPNEATGWVRALDVSTKILTHDVRIDLSDHRLGLYDRGEMVKSYPIGVGKGKTPTPAGEYFVAIKMNTPNPNSVYGVQIMGLSAFSVELTDWPGGGQVGIHGTNDPKTIGTDVSHGCIRLKNADILELSNDVHLGTPVFVQE